MNKLFALFLGLVITTATPAEAFDKRQTLDVSEPQRDHVRAEMRALLSGIQNILAALAKEDMAAVVQTARPLGLGMAHKAEDHLQGALPNEFMTLGLSVHQDFDQLAADAASLNDPKQTLRQLSETLRTCVACHATYQLNTSHAVREVRLAAVAERGRHVMPFNLDQTTHVFSKTAQGGLQQVIAKDSNNVEQIKLIREHLSKISTEFKRGDFSNPAKIHGDTMPGLATLRKAKPGEITVVYKALKNGAEINYSSDVAVLTQAIHQWFDAQLSDHAHHATMGRAHHPMHN